MIPSLRTVERGDIEPIKQLAIDNQMFAPEDVGFFDEIISGHLAGELPDDRWLVTETNGRLTGAAYVAPEPFGVRVWNLCFIATDPAFHGTGIGSLLISTIEEHVESLGGEHAQVLIVETSGTDQYAIARRFYENRRFHRESTIRDYYGTHDHKVTFWKALNR